ncbi:MAG: exodeoxyribonuclease VII small subunit [Catalinimonas sp.]
MTPTSLKAAREELDELLESLEADKTDVEELLGKVRRARELIDFCRTRLRTVGEEIDDLLGEGEESAAPPAPNA